MSRERKLLKSSVAFDARVELPEDTLAWDEFCTSYYTHLKSNELFGRLQKYVEDNANPVNCRTANQGFQWMEDMVRARKLTADYAIQCLTNNRKFHRQFQEWIGVSVERCPSFIGGKVAFVRGLPVESGPLKKRVRMTVQQELKVKLQENPGIFEQLSDADASMVLRLLNANLEKKASQVIVVTSDGEEEEEEEEEEEKEKEKEKEKKETAPMKVHLAAASPVAVVAMTVPVQSPGDEFRIWDETDLNDTVFMSQIAAVQYPSVLRHQEDEFPFVKVIAEGVRVQRCHPAKPSRNAPKFISLPLGQVFQASWTNNPSMVLESADASIHGRVRFDATKFECAHGF
jgi:hypothetical protein